MTVLTYIAPSDYDIKVVEAGEACDVAGLVTLPAVRLDPEQHYAIVLLGDDAAKPYAVKVFPETTCGSGVGSTVRFINASTSLGTASLGASSQEHLVVDNGGVETRATVRSFFHKNVAFGGVAEKNPTEAIDANGYVKLSDMGAPMHLALAEGSATEPILVVPDVSFPQESLKTVVAVGRDDGESHPLELMVCDDTLGQAENTFADCGAR